MDKQKVGHFINQLRKSKGMTQKQLAEKLNVTDKAVSKWERGLGYPDVSILPLLAKALEVTVEEILSGIQTSQMVSENLIVKAEKTMGSESTSSVIKPNSFFHKLHVKVIILVWIVLTTIIGLATAIVILHAGYIDDAICETLLGLLTIWLMSTCVFGFLPLLSCYIWHRLS